MGRSRLGWLAVPAIALLLVVPVPSARGTDPAGSVPPGPGSTLAANASAEVVASDYNCGQGSATFALFANGSGGAPPYTYLWQFGDGTPNSTEQDPVHAYTNVLNFTANLTVTDANLATAHATVSKYWGIPLYCQGPATTNWVGIAVYGLLVAAVVGAAAVLVIRRRRRTGLPPSP